MASAEIGATKSTKGDRHILVDSAGCGAALKITLICSHWFGNGCKQCHFVDTKFGIDFIEMFGK